MLFSLMVVAVGLQAPDTLVIRARNAPIWGARPQLVEELRIGALEGSEQYTFGSVSGVAVTATEQVWVADEMLGTIRRYSADGVHLGDVGRKGEGPGEFNRLREILESSNGNLAVWDPLNTRIHEFEATGEFLRDISVPASVLSSGYNVQSFQVDTAGQFYVMKVDPSPPAFPRYWLRLTADGEIVDTVRSEPRSQEGTMDPVLTWTALSPHGYRVVGRNDEYAFHRPLPDGRTVRVERPWQPVEYRAAERREKQRLEEHFSSRNGRPERRIPLEKPPWAYFEIDAEGRLWVQRYTPGIVVAETPAEREARLRYQNPLREWGQPLRFDVLTMEGRFFGTLEFENGSSASLVPPIDIVFARGLQVWTVEKGRFDEEYVVRYRIEPSR